MLGPMYKKFSGNFLQTFRENLSVPFSGVKFLFLTPEDGTDKLFRNVVEKLPLIAASYPKRAQC